MLSESMEVLFVFYNSSCVTHPSGCICAQHMLSLSHPLPAAGACPCRQSAMYACPGVIFSFVLCVLREVSVRQELVSSPPHPLP